MSGINPIHSEKRSLKRGWIKYAEISLGFVNTLHSEPHDGAFLGETLLCVAVKREARASLSEPHTYTHPLLTNYVCMRLQSIQAQSIKFGSDWNWFSYREPTQAHNTVWNTPKHRKHLLKDDRTEAYLVLLFNTICCFSLWRSVPSTFNRCRYNLHKNIRSNHYIFAADRRCDAWVTI